jgi:predicted secreted protein
MPITAVKGKQCTFTIGTTAYTAWVTSMDLSGEKASETVATWGEDVAYAGAPSYNATVSFLFDPSSSSLGKAMETAFASTTATVSIALAQGAASKSLGSWSVTAYSESMPADGLVTGEASLTGSSIWTTTYTT